MSRLIFVNLAIDQLWDQKQALKQVFPARLPVSEFLIRSNENLGIFLSQPEDTVLALRRVRGFEEFLTARQCTFGHLLDIAANPYDQDAWLSEVTRALTRTPTSTSSLSHRYASLVAVSRSVLEDSLIAKFVEKPTRAGLDTSRLAELNNKQVLLKFAHEGLVKVPPTRILNQTNLRRLSAEQISSRCLFKHEFGSGGGGNFLASQWPLLQRRLSDDDEAHWLMQDKIIDAQEGCVFGGDYGTKNESVSLCEVSYTPHGLSYKHGFSSSFSESVKEEVHATYGRLRERLRTDGYDGPIGIDFLVDRHTNEVFYVDLNLRLTKTHLLLSALQKFRVAPHRFQSYRHRWISTQTCTFVSWWNQLRRELHLNACGENEVGIVILPYSVAGLESPGNLKEVSFFYSASLAQEKDIENALRKITGEPQ
jgi:hypothetical protein